MPVKRRLSIFITLISLLLSRPVLLSAGDNCGGGLDSYFRFIPSRSVEAMPGEVEIIQTGSEYSYTFKAFEKLPLKFSLEHSFVGIENTTGVKLPAHLVGLSADIETDLPFFRFNKTYLRLGVSPSFYSDDWDFPASSFRIPVQAMFIYLPEAKWTFLAGIAVCPDFKIKVLPLFGFIYKPNEKLTFNLIPNRPNISYCLNEKVTLFTEAGAALNSEFEVSKDDLRNVVLGYREMRLGAGIRYKANKFIQASLQAGGGV